MYVILWEFQVPKGSQEEFEKHYGPHGVWARFFKRGAGFLGTELLRDAESSGRYVTIDRWNSSAAYKAFRDRERSEYGKIDRRCEPLSERETRIGTFDLLSG